ncbi:hypothetical protein B296_00005091 [Ensete ventricosum]|uniref:DUF7804 domain-containing protein n=1 Tax=Ensete ventricosum TaxID=4639 RepID=A0A426Z9E3_ENSVE|nr:hypothetical protein B296_00005091 [Ensete ventricosum]
MASSSCALELRAAGLAGQFPAVRKQRKGSSLCSLLAGAKSRRRDSFLEISRGTRATVRAAQAVGNDTTTRLPFSDVPRGEPAVSAAAAGYMNKMEERREVVTPEKLDRWLRESIGEIVRNIGEAPFLMHIFSDGGRGGTAPAVRLEKEAASPEIWPRIKKRWDKEDSTPDAVILVEGLEEGAEEDGTRVEEATVGVVCRRVSRTWGLVVQGRGMDCVACYILNTTRVMSSMGFCTHFCLVRAKCFGEPVDVQLRNVWLQGR